MRARATRKPCYRLQPRQEIKENPLAVCGVNYFYAVIIHTRLPFVNCFCMHFCKNLIFSSSPTASANSALSKPRKTRPATALRCRRSFAQKPRFCARLRIIPCAPQKQMRQCAWPPTYCRVLCAGDLLQAINWCSANPAHAARHGYIILDSSLSAE